MTMYYYFHTTKTSGKSLFYRLGYNLRNEFEFYYSDDEKSWNKFDVISNGNCFELKQINNNDKVTFKFTEKTEEIILTCNIDRESRISFYNDKYEKAAFAHFYELKLVKIAFSFLPLALQRYKFPSDGECSSSNLKGWFTTDDEELSFSPRAKEEKERENDFTIQYNQSDIKEEGLTDYYDSCLNITMQTLGLIEFFLGSGAVAIALTALKIETPIGLATAIGGGVVAFTGFSFFSAGTYRSCNKSVPDPNASLAVEYS